MKINNSLASFGSLIKGLTIWGIIAIVVGILSFSGSRSSDASAALGLILGTLLMYVGFGLIGLAIFGAFLRVTAKSIIEGLGGNLTVSGTQNQPSAAADANPAVEDRINAGPSDAWQSLSGKEYKAWQAAGQPDLRAWDAAGRPDFLTWLNSRTEA